MAQTANSLRSTMHCSLVALATIVLFSTIAQQKKTKKTPPHRSFTWPWPYSVLLHEHDKHSIWLGQLQSYPVLVSSTSEQYIYLLVLSRTNCYSPISLALFTRVAISHASIVFAFCFVFLIHSSILTSNSPH